MNYDLNDKEYFLEIFDKAIRKKNKYDYFIITKDNTKASLYNSEICTIRNSFVIIKREETVQEWIIEDYKVVKCVESLRICIKNLKVLVGCIGNKEEEASYFTIRNVGKFNLEELVIFGAVEVDECATIFYYDGKKGKSYYLNQEAYTGEGTDIYLLTKALRDLEVEIYGKEKDRQLERKEEIGEKMWKDNQW